jgi:hypothetical protein
VLGIARTVLSVPDRDLRRSVRTRHPWMAWVARVGLALVFALGMLSSASGKLYEAEYEPEVEVEVNGEVIAREGKQARVARRTASSMHGGGRGQGLARPRAPQRLEPTVPEPPRPRWQRPRRPPAPVEDDGLSIG